MLAVSVLVLAQYTQKWSSEVVRPWGWHVNYANAVLLLIASRAEKPFPLVWGRR